DAGSFLGGCGRGRGAAPPRHAHHDDALRVPRLVDARLLAAALQSRLRAAALEDEGRLHQHAVSMVQKCPSPTRVFFHGEMDTSRWLTLTRSPTSSGTPTSNSMVVVRR